MNPDLKVCLSWRGAMEDTSKSTLLLLLSQRVQQLIKLRTTDSFEVGIQLQSLRLAQSSVQNPKLITNFSFIRGPVS